MKRTWDSALGDALDFERGSAKTSWEGGEVYVLTSEIPIPARRKLSRPAREIVTWGGKQVKSKRSCRGKSTQTTLAPAKTSISNRKDVKDGGDVRRNGSLRMNFKSASGNTTD